VGGEGEEGGGEGSGEEERAVGHERAPW
jgi:hypothetical protein